MRITTGNFLRRFVYCWQHGHRDVVRVMRGGLEIWPGDEARIRRIAVDMSGVEGTEAGAYWQHVLAYGESNSMWNRASLTIAGRTYYIGRKIGKKPAVSYSQGWLDFGDDGPALRDVRVGEELVVKANVSQRMSDSFVTAENGAVSAELEVPWLPDTRMTMRVWKNRAKSSAGCNFTIAGRPSGAVHIQGFAQRNGHGRGPATTDVAAMACNVFNGHTTGWRNEAVGGDAALHLTLSSFNAGVTQVWILWPSFRKDFRLKVLAFETV